MTADMITELLERKDLEGFIEAAEKERNAFRRLISLTYDKDAPLCWRAIEAVGLLSRRIATTHPDKIRNLAQRLLWMMRDESGNNPGSAAEMIGEIVRNSPESFADLAPIVASFHDEEMLRPGVFRALFRIADVRPDLVDLGEDFLEAHLRDGNPTVRAYALLLSVRAGFEGLRAAVEGLMGDDAMVRIYEEGDLREYRVGDIAARASSRLYKES